MTATLPSLLVASIVASVANAREASGAVTCPARNGGHGPDRGSPMTLFEGDPADQASLVPDSSAGNARSFVNTWNMPSGGAGYVLVCHYDGAKDLVFPLPSDVRRCRSDQVSVVCR